MCTTRTFDDLEASCGSYRTSQSVLFENSFVKPVLAAFDQPASSFDGGALLLKLADERLGLTAAVAGALPGGRAAGKVKHPLLNALRQRVYGIGNGYENTNEAARLRGDPTHQWLLKCPRLARVSHTPRCPIMCEMFITRRNPRPGRGFSGGAEGIRTPDLLNAIQTRSQLRHGPTSSLHTALAADRSGQAGER